MTLNGRMAVISPYVTEFGGFLDKLRQLFEDRLTLFAIKTLLLSLLLLLIMMMSNIT